MEQSSDPSLGWTVKPLERVFECTFWTLEKKLFASPLTDWENPWIR